MSLNPEAQSQTEQVSARFDECQETKKQKGQDVRGSDKSRQPRSARRVIPLNSHLQITTFPLHLTVSSSFKKHCGSVLPPRWAPSSVTANSSRTQPRTDHLSPPLIPRVIVYEFSKVNKQTNKHVSRQRRSVQDPGERKKKKKRPHRPPVYLRVMSAPGRAAVQKRSASRRRDLHSFLRGLYKVKAQPDV